MTTTNLFAVQQTGNQSNARALTGTADLTRIASTAAQKIMEAAKTSDEGIQQIAESIANSAALDKLVTSAEYGDYSSLKTIDDETLESMLKSQQSKRSRCKSKAMTEDNYLSMLSAAIAEEILRDLLGKAKNASGRGSAGGVLSYTDEQIATLTEDQDALRKEIRNIQSKKSIMKSKADYSEEDVRWLALLEAETLLKGLRVGTSGTKYVDATKDTIREMLAEVDVDTIKLAQAKEMLAAIKALVFEEEEIIAE